jgi:hypothetical protein
VAGHIVECGAQATGGNFTDWRRVPRYESIGYPVLEVHADGSFVVTKHPAPAARSRCATVKEQLVYEMGDPRAYITPDVVADFGTIRLEQVGRDRVRVWGVEGAPAPPNLKVSASYFDGWKASGTLIISAPRRPRRRALSPRCSGSGSGSRSTELPRRADRHSACWGPLAPPVDPPEVLLRSRLRDPDKEKIEPFSRLVPVLIPRASGGGGHGRPPAGAGISLWSTEPGAGVPARSL